MYIENTTVDIDELIKFIKDKKKECRLSSEISFDLLNEFLEDRGAKIIPYNSKTDCDHKNTYWVSGVFGGKWCRDCDMKIE